MRKIICISMSVIMLMSLVSCGISESVEKVEDKIIAELEDVMLDDLNVDDPFDASINDLGTLSISTERDTTSEMEEAIVVPTAEPTEVPTLEPTDAPSPTPTEIPTPEPTEKPTPEPTQRPTPAPTLEPTSIPVMVETLKPTPVSTAVPTEAPHVTSVPSIEPVETPTPVECEHKNIEQHYDYWGPPTCRSGSTLYTYCIDCEEFLGWEHFPPLPHEPDEDHWNKYNHCKYWTAGSGAVIQIKCKCGVSLGNRPVTATHNYVPARVYQEVITWDYSAEGGSVSQTGYDIQEYECTECGETYTEILKEYDIVDGEWIEF